jgi:type IV pilus assembly protein PilA
MRTGERGFTLIELLIVIVIIGLLVAIAIPKFTNTKEKAYLAQRKPICTTLTPTAIASRPRCSPCPPG